MSENQTSHLKRVQLKLASIVLLDVLVGLIEQLLVGVEFVLEQRATEFSLYKALALTGVLPVGESNLFNYVVDVGYNALHDDVSVLALGSSKQVGESFLGSIAVFFWRCFLLRFD